MRRRQVLLGSIGSAMMGGFPMQATHAQSTGFRRVRPSDPAWPTQERWDQLKGQVGGRLLAVRSPLAACVGKSPNPDCDALFKQLKNPYFIGDDPALTQTLGWVDGWTSQPSIYAVAAESAADVVAAVNFARENRLRLVVKGGGHTYLGGSNSADSLLIWTRRMNAVTLHDAFLPQGCDGTMKPQPAVSLGAGVMGLQAYDAVMVKGGRYVQGGGCLTVGVAGLVQGGGFGSFSKRYGLAAASLLEAEIVTADGAVRTVNACRDPELFWALKGGGGGTFGVVTRLTLKTHELPPFFGIVHLGVSAKSDTAFRQLTGRLVDLYAERLFNPHWGEQMVFRGNNTAEVTMVFQGIDQHQAEETWRPLFDWLSASKQDFDIIAPPMVAAVPARAFWDPAVLKKVPGVVMADDRAGAPAGNIFWATNMGEAGHVLYGYQSTWLPASLLQSDSRARLVDALFAASRHWGASLHFNKGLAGGPDEALVAARDTATNPAVTEAFALCIIAANAPPAYPGIAGHEPDKATAHVRAEAVGKAMAELRKLVPNAGSYVSETNFHEKDWQQSFWGPNYPRLLAVKEKYDPEGLFFVHHGVGSEKWSADGFTRLGN